MSIDWELAIQIGSFLTSVVVVLGMPIGLFQYIRNARRDRRNREYSAYDATDQYYMDFLRMCFENPQLDIFDIADGVSKDLTSEEKKRELIAFTMLIAVFERAYFIFENAPSGIVGRQWRGWQEYIADYCNRANFQDAWRLSGDQFDHKFQRYMQDTMKRVLDSNHTERLATEVSKHT